MFSFHLLLYLFNQIFRGPCNFTSMFVVPAILPLCSWSLPCYFHLVVPAMLPPCSRSLQCFLHARGPCKVTSMFVVPAMFPSCLQSLQCYFHACGPCNVTSMFAVPVNQYFFWSIFVSSERSGLSVINVTSHPH